MEERRTSLNALDSFRCFLYSLIMPFLFTAAYSFLLVILSAIFKIDHEVFTSNWLVKGFSYIINSLAFLSVFIYYYKKQKIDFNATINYKKNYNTYSILIVILMAAILVFGFNNFIGLIDHTFAKLGYEPNGDLPLKLNSLLNMFVSIMLFGLVPAVCEELLFRGIIFKGLLDKYKPAVAVVIGALLFMLMHGALQQTVYQVILGAVLCLVYYYTKNIFYPILLHFLNNSIVIALGYLAEVSKFDINVVFKSAWSYIWPILVMMLAVAVVVALFYVLMKLNANKYEHVVQTETKVLDVAENSLTNKWMIASLTIAIVVWLLNTIIEWIGY